jgi:hypothetical protein
LVVSPSISNPLSMRQHYVTFARRERAGARAQIDPLGLVAVEGAVEPRSPAQWRPLRRDALCSARPVRELKGFTKVSVEPGQSQQVALADG